jgi:hypothetical protein
MNNTETGVLEYWTIGAETHYSNTPLLQCFKVAS